MNVFLTSCFILMELQKSIWSWRPSSSVPSLLVARQWRATTRLWSKATSKTTYSTYCPKNGNKSTRTRSTTSVNRSDRSLSLPINTQIQFPTDCLWKERTNVHIEEQRGVRTNFIFKKDPRQRIRFVDMVKWAAEYRGDSLYFIEHMGATSRKGQDRRDWTQTRF